MSEPLLQKKKKKKLRQVELNFLKSIAHWLNESDKYTKFFCSDQH